MMNIPYKDLDEPVTPMRPYMQFLIILGITLASMIIGVIIAMCIIYMLYGSAVMNEALSFTITSPKVLNSVWIFQIVSTTLPLFVAPVFFANIIVQQPREYLKNNLKFSWLLILLVFAIMMISSPLIELLSNINQKMHLSGFLQSLQDWMRKEEDLAEKAQEGMMQMKTIGSLVFAIFVVGLLTALAEEFLFRGVIQTIFVRWTKNSHVAIWITAILFSAFHMEFFGFLPRVLLGALFGYFVYWSGSIWTSVWGHFVNNSTVVIMVYLYQHKQTSISPDDQHVFNSVGYIISFIIVLFLFWVYRDIALKKKPVQA